MYRMAATPNMRGLRPGDRIVNIDGTPIPDFSDIIRVIGGAAGKTITVQFLRAGVLQTCRCR